MNSSFQNQPLAILKSLFLIVLAVLIFFKGFSQDLKPTKDTSFTKEHKVSFLNKPIPKALLVSSIGIGVTAFTYFYGDAKIQKFAQKEKGKFSNTVSNFAEPLGRGKILMPAYGGLLALGLVTKNKSFREAGLLAFSSLLINEFVTFRMKKNFQRHRPNTGNPFNSWDGPNGANHNNRSFPSAHTSYAFCTATAIAEAFKEHKAVAPIAYGVATLVGLSRIHDNAHWATDVIIGAAVGYLSAKVAIKAYRFLEKKSLKIIPQIAPGKSSAISLLYQF